MSTNIGKNGVLTSILQENSQSSFNFYDLVGFNNGTSTLSYNSSTSIFTVTSPVSTSTWGAAFSIANNKFYVPYQSIYRVSLEIYVPTAHKIVIDINNKAESGENWSGNDNDLTSARTATTFNIPANVWTTITFGSTNAHVDNTSHLGLYVYDGIGLYTADDTATVTWQFRNPKMTLGWNNKTISSISNTNTIYTNNFYEY